MNPFAKAYWIAKGVGWDNVPRRLKQSFLLRSGTLRKRLDPAGYQSAESPAKLLDASQVRSRWLEREQRFFAIPTALDLQEVATDELWASQVTEVCQEALSGGYPFFSRWQGELGWPPSFNFDPVNKIDWPVGEHWLSTARSGPPRDDIKLVWEASRFTLAFSFARQFVRTEDDQWAEAFWEMLDAWIEQCPVNESVAWACGQEIAFRLFAILTAAFATLHSPSATEERLLKLELLCWQFGKRIFANINYALSQENNHGLSEAIGLWTVGLLFPEFPEAKTWRQAGEQFLNAEIRRQIYPDGSFVQHSMSYHRVMLDDMCWFLALAKVNQIQPERMLGERVAKAIQWLSRFVDTETGRVPNYGANDGANVLPLACADYLDYRPTLQCAAHLLGVDEAKLNAGPWDEKTLWLIGKGTAGNAPNVSIRAWQALDGGYHLLYGPESKAFIRAARFRDRPSQSDMLHLDLWYRGHNILRDAGSYYYYHKNPETKGYFYSVQAHNVVEVAGMKQMVKGPNFLWFYWPEAEARLQGDDCLECRARFLGPNKYSHRRRVCRSRDCFTVSDSVEGAAEYTLRWRLAPEFQWAQTDACQFAGRCGSETYLVRLPNLGGGHARLSNGYESLYYGEREEIQMIEIQQAVGTVITEFGPTSQFSDGSQR